MSTEALTLVFIFCARICDVSIGTIRIILISRGYRSIAPLLGFMEVLIWLTAISSALKTLDNVYSYLIYAAGFAAGNYTGMLLEEKIAIGYQQIRIITMKSVSALPLHLIEEGFEVTTVEGKGREGEVYILYTVVHKKYVKKILEITGELEPDAYITIEDVRSQHGGFISKRNFFKIFSRQIMKKK